MVKVTEISYAIDCTQKGTKISAKVDLGSGVPFVEIYEIGHDRIHLRFFDMESLDQLFLAIKTIKDEMDRFDMSDQSVS